MALFERNDLMHRAGVEDTKTQWTGLGDFCDGAFRAAQMNQNSAQVLYALHADNPFRAQCNLNSGLSSYACTDRIGRPKYSASFQQGIVFLFVN